VDLSHASDNFKVCSAQDKESYTNKPTLGNGINLLDPHSLTVVCLPVWSFDGMQPQISPFRVERFVSLMILYGNMVICHPCSGSLQRSKTFCPCLLDIDILPPRCCCDVVVTAAPKWSTECNLFCFLSATFMSFTTAQILYGHQVLLLKRGFTYQYVTLYCVC